jgi:hypothetical protein
VNIVAGALAGTGPGAGWRLGADEAAANHCVAHTLRADGFDASEDGTGRGTPLVPVGVDYTNGLIQGDISGTLEAAQSKGNRGQGVIQPMAFGWQNAAAQGTEHSARINGTSDAGVIEAEITRFNDHQRRAQESADAARTRGQRRIERGVVPRGRGSPTANAQPTELDAFHDGFYGEENPR